ncbi:MAG: hypothetical protein EGQ14_03030 [Spirochaetia bacterium]|nr:hypothetical protein [Spirochaetia bacterium]
MESNRLLHFHHAPDRLAARLYWLAVSVKLRIFSLVSISFSRKESVSEVFKACSSSTAFKRLFLSKVCTVADEAFNPEKAKAACWFPNVWR